MDTPEVDARASEPAAPPLWSSPSHAAQALRSLLRLAVLAPSRHNSQPWLFEIEGPEARVYGDVRRALRVADADRRELVLSCAAAIENLRVAVRHHGRAATVELLAPRAGGLVARLRVEEPRPPDAGEEALFGAIPVRRTNRLAFDEREPEPGVVARLARDAADAGASLRVVEENARLAVAEIVADADREQWGNAAYRAELASWTRTGGANAIDGVPGHARGLGPAAALLSLLKLRFADPGRPEQRRDRQHLLHAPALLVLCTAADSPRDWATAGVAFERVLLRAAAAGLSASYYSAAIEVPAARARLREALGETGFPQVLFRVGHGPRLRSTPRRPTDTVLRAFRVEPPPSTALVEV
jgi:hypothetical protein